MSRWSAACLLLLVAAHISACERAKSPSETRSACSESWYRMIERKVPTGDGRGHGPDVGSEEWKSVVEFKLGIRGEPGLPSRDSEAWCRDIDEIVRSRPEPSAGSGNSDPAALEKATNEHPPRLQAEQRGWIKGRDDCWKSEDPRRCVRGEYVRRIAALQAWYRLVPYTRPVRHTCGGNPADEVVATYVRTDPPTLIAERGDSVSLMYQESSASGTRYQGRNESLWEHQGEATITWGYGAPEIHCKKDLL